MDKTNSQRPSYWILILPWISWFVAAMFYTNQYFLRVSVSSLAPTLISNFHIGALTLASVAAMFYYAFMFTQLFSGILIDYYGARIMLTFASALCGFSAIIFAYAPNVAVLEVSRVLMGIGASFSFVGVITLARAWFPANRFALVNGITLTFGTLGAVFGEGPLSRLLGIYNWQNVISELGLVSFVLAFCIGAFVQNEPLGGKAISERIGADGLREHLISVFKNRQIWSSGLVGSFMFVPISAFAALWCAPFLQAEYAINHITAEYTSSLIFLGVGVGAPLLAWFSNTLGMRLAVIRIAAGVGLLMLLLIIYTHVSLTMVSVFGFFISGFSLAFVVVRESTKRSEAATAFSLTNLLKLLGGAVVLQVIGGILDVSGKLSLHHFREALIVLPISLLAAILVSLLMKEPGKLTSP